MGVESEAWKGPITVATGFLLCPGGAPPGLGNALAVVTWAIVETADYATQKLSTLVNAPFGLFVDEFYALHLQPRLTLWTA